MVTQLAETISDELVFLTPEQIIRRGPHIQSLSRRRIFLGLLNAIYKPVRLARFLPAGDVIRAPKELSFGFGSDELTALFIHLSKDCSNGRQSSRIAADHIKVDKMTPLVRTDDQLVGATGSGWINRQHKLTVVRGTGRNSVFTGKDSY